MLIYDDTPKRRTFGMISPDLNAMTYWAEHYANLLILKFFLANGNTQEKIDASNEIHIGERKLKFWERHPTYDKSIAEQIAIDLKQKWKKTT